MVNKELLQKLPALKECLAREPIEKAWVFGSFSRGEETDASDVDIMVCYRNDMRVSLFTIGHIYNEIKKVLGREVDLVEDGFLMPYAQEEAYKDRILIYERGNK